MVSGAGMQAERMNAATARGSISARKCGWRRNARSSEPNRIVPSGSRAQYSGLTPTRSRTSHSSRSLRSHRASAKIPLNFSIEALNAPDRDRFENDLGVGMAAPLDDVPGAREFGPDVLGVVEFAVVDRDPAPAGRVHRLRAGRRHIDDRQPAVAEGEPGLAVGPDAFGIRAAMGEGAGHGGNDFADVGGRRVRAAEEAG